jgi:hypothetical protein
MTEPSSPTPHTARVNEDVPDVGAALTALLEAKNADGTPRWSLKDFHATFPPMMLHLMTHVPFLEMPPEGQELCLMAMGQMGLDTDATDEQIAVAVEAYVTANPPNQQLLAEIQGLLVKAFDQNDARLVDAGRKLAGQRSADLAARAPKLGEKAPEGAMSGADLARQMQKKIPLR